jgi:peptidoglycan/LPS O-acetylase OafA/YrhL
MNRILSLDVLRGVAILLVLGRHAHFPAGWAITDAWKQGGWVGVDLFFVLSGFLISGLLFREYRKFGRVQTGRFLIRRAFKIYPAFWALVAVTVLLRIAVGSTRHLGYQTLIELLFLQSYSADRLYAHTWSLSVEEQFYLLLPVLLLAIGYANLWRLNRVIPMVMVGLLAARCLTAGPFDAQTHLFPAYFRFDSLLAGVLASWWYHTSPAFVDWCRRWYLLLLVSGLGLILPAFLAPLETRWVYTVGLTAFALGSVCVLLALVCRGVPANRFTSALGKVGVYSYSIYLWHDLMLWLVVPLFLGPWLVQTAYFAVSIGFGMLAAEVVETPALRLRDRWFPAGQKGEGSEGRGQLALPPARA